eukprot:CAMPEP_0178984464 /NCGR_PEP_ID=MMETSP0795-20121207/1619_1 /TAXON_ID=88552 /ORGANISM="Amoebophrya sp., Strain Ameob2" /LENGTH=352 /DNA_ID=CAMNT_0020675329 /DNA_START=437 /DNA_END=1495 /DNA_ORIENTATION=+
MAEFVGAIFLLVFNVSVYTNFIQYMWRKGKGMGRKRNPAATSVYLLVLALAFLAVDPVCTILKHVGWDTFSAQNLPRYTACEGEGANRKCKKSTFFGWCLWATTLTGLVVMAVAMWAYTVAMGSNCVVTAYDIAYSSGSAGPRKESKTSAGRDQSGSREGAQEMDQVSDHAAHGSGRKGRTPISGAASPEGEAHPEDLENPTESTALLGGNGSEEEEPAMEPAVNVEPFDFEAQMAILRDDVDLLGAQMEPIALARAERDSGDVVEKQRLQNVIASTLTQLHREEHEELPRRRAQEERDDAGGERDVDMREALDRDERMIGGAGGQRRIPATGYSSRTSNQAGGRGAGGGRM